MIYASALKPKRTYGVQSEGYMWRYNDDQYTYEEVFKIFTDLFLENIDELSEVKIHDDKNFTERDTVVDKVWCWGDSDIPVDGFLIDIDFSSLNAKKKTIIHLSDSRIRLLSLKTIKQFITKLELQGILYAISYIDGTSPYNYISLDELEDIYKQRGVL